MNELQIFNNPEFGEIRAIEIDGEPWFVGKDVATALLGPVGAVAGMGGGGSATVCSNCGHKF